MKLTRAALDTILTGYSTKLNEGLSKANTDFAKWCDTVSSQNVIETYPMTQLNSGMTEWIGERIISKFSGKMTSIRNLSFQNSVRVNRDDLMYDRMNLYNSKFVDLGIGASNLWPKLAALVLLANTTWADGKAFFCSDRQINDEDSSILLDNLVAGGFSVENYAAARLKGRKMTDSNGDPLELVHDLLIVGPKHERLANQMKNSEFLADGVTNDLKGSFELQVNGRFIGDYEDDFRLLCTTRGAKPVIVQKVKEGGLIAVDDEKDSHVFKTNENLYGIHYIGNAGPGLPQLAIAGIPAST